MGRLYAFEYEAEMCATLTTQLERLCSSGFRVSRHLHVGAEIPDYVVAFAPQSHEISRLGALECAVLAKLHDLCCARAEEIAVILFARSERVEAALQTLRKLGYAARNADRYAPSCRLQGASVVAIEAKLTRWKDALEQAVSYRRFSNASFVALPWDVVDARRATFVRDCSAASIGLISVASGRMSIEVAPPFHQPRTAEWVWTAVRALASEKPRTSEKRQASCVDGSSSFAG